MEVSIVSGYRDYPYEKAYTSYKNVSENSTIHAPIYNTTWIIAVPEEG